MTVSDLERVYENESLQAADVEAFQKMLREARLKLHKTLEDICKKR